ncbi:MAG TPA: adenylate/guanylate cyclase domain-containing protein, partial [Herpetosiphonaceae bacterium]
VPWPLAPAGALADAALPLLSFVAQAALATLLLRLWMYLARSWDRFRRRRLRWALAHALLLVVVAATLAWVAVSSIRNASGSYEFVFHVGSIAAPAPPPESGEPARVVIRSDEVAADLAPPPLALRLLNTFDQKMTSMLLSGSALLLAIMPPFALFSWAVARRVTGRLESLVAAAGALGSGDYAARVAVSGEDELAQLQAHFNAMADRLQQAMDELEGERQKSEGLLLNILPRNVVDRLKDQPGLIADDYPEVTVLFADIVNFTQRAARLAPEAMLAWLNHIFSTFDQLAEAHGLEKIKTIGDAYMVVGGAPTKRPDHASAVAELALAMQRAVGEMTDPHGQPLRMRIGVNTGEVIAGVIGTRKFIYDLWGDAVNTASRMESQGVEGGIQVTEATYRLLRGSYRFARRGTLQIKGKGAMTTYLLLGPRAEPRGIA